MNVKSYVFVALVVGSDFVDGLLTGGLYLGLDLVGVLAGGGVVLGGLGFWGAGALLLGLFGGLGEDGGGGGVGGWWGVVVGLFHRVANLNSEI